MKIRNHIIPRLIGGLLFVLVVLTSAPAAFAQTDIAEADAVVVSPLSLVPVDDLNFGNLIPGLTGGTAVVSTTGVRTVTGSVVAAGGAVSNAEFQGYGSRNRFVYITSGSGSYILNRIAANRQFDADILSRPVPHSEYRCDYASYWCHIGRGSQSADWCLRGHFPDHDELFLIFAGLRGGRSVANRAYMIDAPEIVRTAKKRNACDGATGIPGGAALGHPRVWLEIDEKGYVDCGYCDRRFVLTGGPADVAPAQPEE